MLFEQAYNFFRECFINVRLIMKSFKEVYRYYTICFVRKISKLTFLEHLMSISECFISLTIDRFLVTYF